MVHSHIDGVRLQRSIAEIISVVLHHTVIVPSDHIRSCRSVIVPHQGWALSRCTASTSDVCIRAWRPVPQRTRRVGEPLVSQVRGRTIEKRILPVGQVLDVLHCDRKLEREGIAGGLSQICADVKPCGFCLHFVFCELRTEWRTVKQDSTGGLKHKQDWYPSVFN